MGMGRPKVQISDDWTPKDWQRTNEVLKKDVQDYGTDFRLQLRTELLRHHFRGGGVAVDIGCGEGAFTESWLGLLTALRLTLPNEVYLIEPQAPLLAKAQERFELLQKQTGRFRNIMFTPHPQKLTSDNWHSLICSANLLVASHMTYYFSEEELHNFFLNLRRGMLAPGGLAWIIVRDRHCNLYRKRFALLRENDIQDTQAHQFSDHVLHIVRQSGLLWTTIARNFPIETEHLPPEEATKVFYFLTHLKGPWDLHLTNADWRFSETHILASVPQGAEPTDAVGLADDGDEDAFHLLAATYERLARYGFIVLDLQLARIQPEERATVPRARYGLELYHPRRIAGSLYRWGWQWKEVVEEALVSYFTKHPSFLLFDCFYSPFRPPCVSETLTKCASKLIETPPEVMFKRLEPKPLPLDWPLAWETSTFDIAWVEWCHIVGESWREILRREQLDSSQEHTDPQIRCFAVPARLAEVSGRPLESAVLVNTAAAIFGTVVVSSASIGASLPSVCRDLSALLTSHVGELVYQRLAEVVADLKTANTQLEEVRKTARELSLALNEVQPQVRRIVELTSAGNPLDLETVRELFNDQQIELYRQESMVVSSAHDFGELTTEHAQYGWLGVAIYRLLGVPMPESLQNGHEIFQTAHHLLDRNDPWISPCLITFLRSLVVPLEPAMPKRAFELLRSLIRNPNKPNQETTLFAFAIRVLIQAPDEQLAVCIKHPDEGWMSLTRANVPDSQVSPVIHEPTFPALSGVCHTEWFQPVSSMVAGPLGRHADKRIYVSSVEIEQGNEGCRLVCKFSIQDRQEGSVEGIKQTLEHVRQIYPHRALLNPGNLPPVFWGLVKLEKDFGQRIRLEIEPEGLIVHIG
jgi:hypothetical protein